MTMRKEKAIDALIVLGGGVDAQGRLTQLSRERVREAVRISVAGRGNHILFSGGWGLFQKRPPVTEAQAMKEYAPQSGCDDDLLRIDESSRDTFGNAYFSYHDWVRTRGWRRCTIVTSDFHLPRVRLLFRKAFPKSVRVDFRGAATSVAPGRLVQWRMQEDLLMVFLREVLADLPDHDPSTFGRVLRREHPAYAQRASALAADFQKAFRSIHALVHGGLTDSA